MEENKPPIESFFTKDSPSVESRPSNNNQILTQLLSKISPQAVGYSVAGGTAPQDVGGMLADKVTGQNSGIGGIAPKAEMMRQQGVNNTTQDPVSNIALNIATDPMTYLGSAEGIGAAKNLVKAEGSLQKSVKAKTALDTLRSTLGTAKSLAIKQVEEVPTKLDMTMAKSQKVVSAIQNPIYGVEFTQEGGLKQTVGNLDKVKEAVGELIHTDKIWEEAPSKELRLVKQFYGQVNNAMKSASRAAGKPIDEALNAYSEFMNNYHFVNKTLVDTAGNAMGNKLTSAFKLGAEPAYRAAWKEVSKASPEIRKVMTSMSNRALLSTLLKTAGYGGAGAYATKQLSKIAGSMAGNSNLNSNDE